MAQRRPGFNTKQANSDLPLSGGVIRYADSHPSRLFRENGIFLRNLQIIVRNLSGKAHPGSGSSPINQLRLAACACARRMTDETTLSET